jgi:hypothetical protein
LYYFTTLNAKDDYWIPILEAAHLNICIFIWCKLFCIHTFSSKGTVCL